MKLFILFAAFILVACNPELQQVGANKNDLVKYFKISPSGANSLGEGVLIIAHAGE